MGGPVAASAASEAGFASRKHYSRPLYTPEYGEIGVTGLAASWAALNRSTTQGAFTWAPSVENGMSRRWKGEESGDTINASGIAHGARYGLDVEPGEEEDTYVIDGEVYRMIEPED